MSYLIDPPEQLLNNAEQIRNEIIRFKNCKITNQLRNYYNTKSYSEILGVSRREISHSNFISWILNPNEVHGLDTYPIKKILEILIKTNKPKPMPDLEDLFDTIAIGDYEVRDIKINNEFHIEKVGRVDLVLTFNLHQNNESQQFRLIIENKVGTKEHSDQTTKYYDHFSKLDDNTRNIYIFLTPISGIDLDELEEVECSCKEYIQINYQYIVDMILEPILDREASLYTKNIIKDYILTLSKPTQPEDEKEYKKGLIMAIGDTERNLLTKFWNEHQKLIQSALYAISSDSAVDKEERENASEILSIITSKGKNKSLVKIMYGSEIWAEKIKKSDIGHKLVSSLIENGLVNSEIFEFLREDKSSSFKLLKKEDEFTEGEIKYKRYKSGEDLKIEYKGNLYYASRNWGMNNIEKFIDKMEMKFKGLKFSLESS